MIRNLLCIAILFTIGSVDYAEASDVRRLCVSNWNDEPLVWTMDGGESFVRTSPKGVNCIFHKQNILVRFTAFDTAQKVLCDRYFDEEGHSSIDVFTDEGGSNQCTGVPYSKNNDEEKKFSTYLAFNSAVGPVKLSLCLTGEECRFLVEAQNYTTTVYVTEEFRLMLEEGSHTTQLLCRVNGHGYSCRGGTADRRFKISSDTGALLFSYYRN